MEQAVEPGEELLLDDEIEGEKPEVEEAEEQAETEADADETVISFGDEAAPASDDDAAPEWVRDVRKRNRELERENAALKKAQASPVKIEMGPRPTLESCEYDEDRFADATETWLKQKAEAGQAETQALKAAENAQAAWQAEVAEYGQRKAKLERPDFDEVEDEVTSRLNHVQQAIIVKGKNHFDPAAMIYALGKNPQKLASLAAIEDPVEFAFVVAKLGGQLKVSTRRKAPEPEGTLRGSASLSASTDAHLARLEREAERTGDRTKIVQYRRSLKAK
jgi:hypothetical protein